MQNRISISVRQIVEFTLRGGSIDNRFGGMDRAAEGSRIHRKLQRAGGEDYRAEVPLSMESACGDYIIYVEGRADGIITNNNGTTIDEIKTTSAPLEYITEDFNRLHWAQAMCYGHFYCAQNDLKSISIRLTYYQVDTDEIKRFTRAYTADELESFYKDLLEKYRIWTDMQQHWNIIRDASIKALDFPYPEYRKGQRELAVTVYRTVRGGGKLFCQAPTGIGKTISTLFPSIKAIGEGEAERIFYLTAKTITRQAAENACSTMREKGLKLKTVTLTAKDKICFMEKRECNPDACPYAKGHFDRVNDAIFELLQKEDNLSREVIEGSAKKHFVCPFELSLDLTLWSDCIIADYNYVFDPQVYLRRFFTDNIGSYVFLIDEAHNLVDRAREMFSAALKKSAFLQISKQLDKKSSLRKAIMRINKAMAAMRRDCGENNYYKSQKQYEDFYLLLMYFIPECELWLKEHPHAPQNDELLTLYFDVLSFIKTAEMYDERYITLVDKKGSEVGIRLFCLDPSFLLSEQMKKAKAVILFSATLTPLDYFISILGGDAASKRLMLPSPFPRGNFCLLISDCISTKYKDRENSLTPVSVQIAQTVFAKKGNYIVYFPSYSYMQAVYNIFNAEYPEINTVIQESHMDEQARENFLNRFQADNSETLVGFCVMGGIYGEGIDLKGDRLIGTVIVGVGLPQISLEQDIIREYFDLKNGSGFAFAYQYPGMNKVMQAAGRVIRDMTDRGVALLIDERFTSQTYKYLLPAHWQGYKTVANDVDIQRELKAFWDAEY